MGMADVYQPPFKTRVYKSGDSWLVSFYSPYGYASWYGYSTWRRAMTEACEIETRKAKNFYYV